MRIDYDAEDLNSLSLVMWREARGEGHDGMRAVGHVICNRVGALGFPRTLHDVIYQKNAFTSMSVSSDPEFNLVPPPGDTQFAYCSAICPSVLNGSDVDPTFGAHYYENAAAATSGWFARVIAGPDGYGTEGHSLTAHIGKQVFFI
jgi:N-acetylmuramoyl-L-alanine amidase